MRATPLSLFSCRTASKIRYSDDDVTLLFLSENTTSKEAFEIVSAIYEMDKQALIQSELPRTLIADLIAEALM